MAERKCMALKTSITNDRGAVVFPCPGCGETDIIRSKRARQIVAKYTCSKCGFCGPN
ncbi:MAG: zinc finger domain-containing protein [Nanoarchaeota archaeon]